MWNRSEVTAKNWIKLIFHAEGNKYPPVEVIMNFEAFLIASSQIQTRYLINILGQQSVEIELENRDD